LGEGIEWLQTFTVLDECPIVGKGVCNAFCFAIRPSARLRPISESNRGERSMSVLFRVLIAASLVFAFATESSAQSPFNSKKSGKGLKARNAPNVKSKKSKSKLNNPKNIRARKGSNFKGKKKSSSKSKIRNRRGSGINAGAGKGLPSKLSGTWQGVIVGTKKQITFFMQDKHFVFVDHDSVVVGEARSAGKTKAGDVGIDFKVNRILAHGGKNVKPSKFKLPAKSLASASFKGKSMRLCSRSPGAKGARPSSRDKGKRGVRCISMKRVSR
jgi:hypothetical protein